MFKNAVGLLGGTFNPIHNGHIRNALLVKKHFSLQQIQIIPCASPPHKTTTNLLPFDLRLEIIKASITNKADLHINPLEKTLEPPSYSWDMLTLWKKLYPKFQPFFIVSSEDFSTIDSWFRGFDLPNISNFIIIPRSNGSEDLFHSTIKRIWNCSEIKKLSNKSFYASPYKQYKCIFFKIPILNISSSSIRSLWIQKLPLNILISNNINNVLNKYKEKLDLYWTNNA